MSNLRSIDDIEITTAKDRDVIIYDCDRCGLEYKQLYKRYKKQPGFLKLCKSCRCKEAYTDEIRQRVSKTNKEKWENRENKDEIGRKISNKKKLWWVNQGYVKPVNKTSWDEIKELINNKNYIAGIITSEEDWNTEKINNIEVTCVNKHNLTYTIPQLKRVKNCIYCMQENKIKEDKEAEKYILDIFDKNFIDKIHTETLKKKRNLTDEKLTQERNYNSRKLNKTFNSSKEEDEIYILLKDIFNNTYRNYKSDSYPWSCDFYIPEIDTYIEFQGSWTHGKEPFDENNVEHLKQLKKWSDKSKEMNFKNENKKFYIQAIKTWTIRDVEKRRFAKEHDINWLEFFTFEQFNEWIESRKNQVLP